MLLLLIRHAEAEPGDPDALRPLTAAGRAAARALGEDLHARGVTPTAVLTSPLLRARETADAIARAAGIGAETDERLAPGAGPEDVQAVIAGRGDVVAVVAHQPDCSEIAAMLTGLPPRPFPPGHLLEIEL